MSNRAIRRQIMRQEKEKYKKMIGAMTEQQINEKLLQQGIGQADLDAARYEGQRDGYRDGGLMMTRTCYAAAIRTLKRDWKFTEDQLIEFLKNMDVITLTCIDHQEMVTEAFEETGILLNLGDGVDRVQVRPGRGALCFRCALGKQISGNTFDCDALDGPVSGRCECEYFHT